MATAVIHDTGNVTCVGTTSVQQCKMACRKFARIIQKLDYPTRVRNFKIHNIAGTYNCGFEIKMEKFASNGIIMNENFTASWVYSSFGDNSKCGANVFATGKIVLFVSKSEQHIQEMLAHILLTLQQYRSETGEDEEKKAKKSKGKKK